MHPTRQSNSDVRVYLNDGSWVAVATRSPHAKALESPLYRRRVVRNRKAYNRKGRRHEDA